MSAAGAGAGPMLAVRIVTADYYLAEPLPGLDVCGARGEARGRRVPVVRVFGATPAGQKTCLHLHGIFPYIYVPYDGHGQDPDRFLRQITFSIDRALNVALGNPSSTVQHVFKISLVSGMPFYGYHEKEKQFMKIYLYNPAMVKRVCELLQGGAVMNKCYQPHEAHVPYLLQLFIDYNLYGMNLINLAAVKFRKTRRKGDEIQQTGSHKGHSQETSFNCTLFRWEEDEIPSSLILYGVEPQSTCELEVDGVAADILNRQEMEAQIGRNPGLQAIWEDEKQRRRDKNESSQISPPDSQDRGYVPATESEKIFQKRIKEILKQDDFSVTLSGSLDYSNASDEFSAELTLHSEVLSQEVVPCTPANMVEVHKDQEPVKGNTNKNESELEDAVIDESAILNIMETSQTFQHLSQRLSQSPVFMNSSQDQALINLLAGLEDDGYQMSGSMQLSQQHFSEKCSNFQNSDDEESEPQIAKEEMELSLLMSQRWDSVVEEDDAKRQLPEKPANGSSTEEEESSSGDEMEWNGNNLLVANLAIPQLDGTADENSDNPLNNENSRTHSSVIATSKMSVKNSIFHNDAATFEAQSSSKTAFHCQHTSALSSHVLKKDLTAEVVQPNLEKGPEFSVRSLVTNESTYSGKYSAPFRSTPHSVNVYMENRKDILPIPSSEKNIYDFDDEVLPVSRHVHCRKYTSIRKAEKDTTFMHSSRHNSDSTLERNSYNFSDFNRSKSKIPSEGNEKGSGTSVNSFFPSALSESCDLVSCSGGNKNIMRSVEPGSNEGKLNNLKIRYEEFQEHKADVSSLSQQAAHYMFFPSVVLSNCLNRPQKLAPVTYKLQQGTKQPRLKLSKKRLSQVNQEPATVNDKIDFSSHQEFSNPNDKQCVTSHMEQSCLNDKMDLTLHHESTIVIESDFTGHLEPACVKDRNALHRTTPADEKTDLFSQCKLTTVKEKMDLSRPRKRSILKKKADPTIHQKPAALNEKHDPDNQKKCSNVKENPDSVNYPTATISEEIDPAIDRKVTTVNEATKLENPRKPKSVNEKINQSRCRKSAIVKEKNDLNCHQTVTTANEEMANLCRTKCTSVNDKVDLYSHQKLKSVIDELDHRHPTSIKEEMYPACQLQPTSVKEETDPDRHRQPTSVKVDPDSPLQQPTFVKKEIDPTSYQQPTSVNDEMDIASHRCSLSVNDQMDPTSLHHSISKNNMHPDSHWQPTFVNDKMKSVCDQQPTSVNIEVDSASHCKSKFVNEKQDLVSHFKLNSVNEKSDLVSQLKPQIVNEEDARASHQQIASIMEKTHHDSHHEPTNINEVTQEKSVVNDKICSASHNMPALVNKKCDPVNHSKPASVNKRLDSANHPNPVFINETSDHENHRKLSIKNKIVPAFNRKTPTAEEKVHPVNKLSTVKEKLYIASPVKPPCLQEDLETVSQQVCTSVDEKTDPGSLQKPTSVTDQMDPASHALPVSVNEDNNPDSYQTHTDLNEINPASHQMATSVTEKMDAASHKKPTSVAEKMYPDGHEMPTTVNEENDPDCHQKPTVINEKTDPASHQNPTSATENQDPNRHQNPTSVGEKTDPDSHLIAASVNMQNNPASHENPTAVSEQINPASHRKPTVLNEEKDTDGHRKPTSVTEKMDSVTHKPACVNEEMKRLNQKPTHLSNPIVISMHQKPSCINTKMDDGLKKSVNEKTDLLSFHDVDSGMKEVDTPSPKPACINNKIIITRHLGPTGLNNKMTLVSRHAGTLDNGKLDISRQPKPAGVNDKLDLDCQQKRKRVNCKLQIANQKEPLKLNRTLGLASHRKAKNVKRITCPIESCCAQSNVYSNRPPDKDSALSCQLKQTVEGTLESKIAEGYSVAGPLEEELLDSEAPFGFHGNKYTLRAKRKINYEIDDGEPSVGAPSSKMSVPQPMEVSENVEDSQKALKRRKISNKLPPIIIKYIIVNRFKGQKNMLVKIGKIDHNEEQVKLTEEKVNLYKKMAPLKDFWPKVPDSPATKFPLTPSVPKKCVRKKAKHKSSKKKPGKPPHTGRKTIKRNVPFRRKRTPALLNPPLPSYNAEAEDCDMDYTDVMSKLGFLSERSPSPVNSSPPRCWSPTDPATEDIVTSKENLCDVDGNICNNKIVNSNLGKKCRKAIKTRRKVSVTPSEVNKKRNKSIQTKVANPPKIQRSKTKQKTNETGLSKNTIIKSGTLSVNCEVQILPKQQDIPVAPINHSGPQAPVTQPDFSFSGFSTGHLPSTQLPSTLETAVDLPSCFRPLTGTDNPVDFQHHPLVHNGLQSSVVSCFTSSAIAASKMNPERTHSQSIVFKMKEPSFVQNKTLDLSKHLTPATHSAQLSLGTVSTKTENTTPLLKRPLFMGRSGDSHSCVDTTNKPLNATNVLPKKDCVQQIMRIQDKTKQCDIYSPENAYSGENHGPIHLPKNCFLMSLKSPVKPIGWEQKQKGGLKMATVSPRVNQRCVPETSFSANVIPQTNRYVGPPLPADGQTGIDVLKELLYKRHHIAQQNNVIQEPLSKPQPNRTISCIPEQNGTIKKSQTVTSRKPRIPRSAKAKEKTPRVLKADSMKQQCTSQTVSSASNGSPVFLSDPDFESCYSIEDSLSPEHTYNFDINSIGQTGFCSLYSGSQFVPADQNLPQKFLSDAIQEPFAIQTENDFFSHDNLKSKEEKPGSSHQTTRVKSSPLSPELFEKSSVNLKEDSCRNQWNSSIQQQILRPGLSIDSFCFQQPGDYLEEQLRRSRKMVNKDVPVSLSPAPHSSDWIQIGLNYNRKQSSYEVCQPVNSVSTSFSGQLSSPDGEFMDVASDDFELYISRRNDGLTPTPDSSPRSVSSPSQSKNGSCTPRTAHILKPLMCPPSRDEIMATLLDHDLMETVYQEPFFSNPLDAPEKPREIGGRLLTVETRLPNNLPEFEGDFSLDGLRLWKTAFSVLKQNHRPTSPTRNCQSTAEQGNSKEPKTVDDKKLVIMPCKSAPSRLRTQIWLQAKEEYERSQLQHKDQLVMPVSEKHSSQVLCDEHSVLPSKEAIVVFSQPATTQASESSEKHKIPEQDPPSDTSDCTQTSSKCRGAPDSPPENELDGEAIDEYYENYSSPDSPPLPTWQNVVSPKSQQCDPDDEVLRQQEKITTPVKQCSPVFHKNVENHMNAEAKCPFISDYDLKGGHGKSDSVCRHSTPLVQRQRRESVSETLACTPVSSSEPKLKKLKHKRGDGTDRLRRILLTTQMKNQFAAINCTKKEHSQIEGPSLNNSYGFKVTAQNLQEAKALHEVQHLTLISMELHARTRRDLAPDPEFDPICALFYCISSDTVLPNSDKTELTGAIVIEKDGTGNNQGSRGKAPLLLRSGITELEVTYATDEKQLFQEVVNIVRRHDPDILLGYEVQMHSWGYLLQRAAALDVDLCQMISRVPDDKVENRFAAEKDEYGADTMSEINVVGRIVLNVWRMMKTEVALTNYSFENVAFHVLHQRFPLFTFRVLSDWFDNRTDLHRWKMVDHYICRVSGILKMLDQLDLIGRTSELARLFGIQFLHVLTRGSQYRVESMMLRIAKPMNYIAVTPSVQQRAQMKAPQCIPLVMEPESRFYSNSILVLDFQSLYPSIVIAYNYCYSTCLGFVENVGKYDEFNFGCSSLRVPPDLLNQIRHDITVSPGGVAFVKDSVRKGVLPRMLEDILKTRLMVKQSMKSYKHDKGITRMLDARQLGLKLIANVTYGYTAANFSGRMPCMEIGDSILHKARETLERAIKLVNDTKKWGARVVYGDTDSLFVLLKGATKEQSFKIGQEIADAVTATNPKPVKLKFEKVYLPCVLQTKKRYVGYMYETLDQKDPVFDAKGIETVRRDSCPAVGKILERSIKLLFETRDISQIKLYVQRQCMKLLEGKASMQDLIFAKEYRGSSSYRPGACVPALELTRKMLAYDRRSEPRVGERVPYVIVYGTPGMPLIQLVRRPIEVLQDPNLRLNATYYITKQILPPLNRLFSLIGVDVFSWYDELPRVQKACSTARNEQGSRKGTISQYFTTLHCPVCDELTQHGICSKCRTQPQQVAVILNQEIRELEHKQDQLVKICKNCTGCYDRQIQCVSLNCPVLFKRSSASRELSKAPYYRQLLDQF